MNKIFAYCAKCDIGTRVAVRGKYHCSKCGGEMQVREVKESPSMKFELKKKS